MTITDDMLSAFLDGELPPEEMKRVAAAIDADAGLRRRAEALAAPDAIIKHAYSAIDDAPMPASVTALLADAEIEPQPENNVIALRARVTRQREIWRLPIAASIALAAGIALGLSITPKEGVQIAGAVKPGDALFAALETTPSGETRALADGLNAAMVLTFRAGETWCREFTLAGPNDGARAIACREEDAWAVKLVAAEAPAGEGYATAASAVSAAFDAGAVALGADEPLDAAREAALLRSGWAMASD